MKREIMLAVLLALGGMCGFVRADDQTTPVPDTGEVEVVESAVSQEATAAAPELMPFDRVVPEATQVGGPITTYRKKDNLYWEITGGQLDVDYIIAMSVARGVGTADLYGGQSLDFGEDMLWRFRKVDDRIQIVRRNFRYRADKGPDSEALRVAFGDSIIFSLPIIARGPQGGDVVDVTNLFMSDTLAMISARALGGFSFAADRSSWEKVKGLKDNLELEVAATYAGRPGESDTIIDTRGVSVNIHYSISRLKDTGYQPRYADERVGYFMTALRDVSKTEGDDNFTRYIDRWNLQKLEPNAEKSLPKKPIVFWLDKAVPYQYRKTLRDGILEWNKAFEKAGFYNAIEVRQQEDNDEWDPEDINYNTIRWSATQTGFSIGPHRVNPTTGEILDADVVLSVGFLKSWASQFELYSTDQLVEKFSSRDRDELLKNESDYDGSDIHNRRNDGDMELFYSQQVGLAEVFFDIMAMQDVAQEEPAPQPQQEAAPQEDEAAKAAREAEEAKKAEEERLAAEEAAKKAEEEAKAAEEAAKAREEQRRAEEEAVKATAEKAAEAAQKAADDAKKAAEELASANEAQREELSKKAQEAKDAADVALRVAQEASKKLDELRAEFEAVKQAEAAKKAEEEAKAAEAAKQAEEAKKKADEEAKKAEEAKQAEKAAEEKKQHYESEKKKMFEQALRQLVVHEVGHTLGLRHNFKQSALHSLDEINDASKWTERGYVGSVMEYSPINIMPQGRQQGDYYSYHLGEYDEWVIEYGYKVFPGKSTDSEVDELKKIAARQSRPEFNYATDEDCYGSTIDPYVNIWDLGSSPLEYAKVRVELVDQIMPKLNDRIVKDGESYRRLQTRFNMLNSWKAGAMEMAANYIGGIKVNRDFKGDENGRKPFEVVPAQEQRDAMNFLLENVFSVDAYKIPADLFNYLAPNRWRHWGVSIPDRYDMDVHANILSWQRSVMNQLLSNLTLSHLADAELRVPEGEDVFTSAEMLDSMTGAIFKEIFDSAAVLKAENREGAVGVVVSSQRRNLQRAYLDRLTSFATSASTSAGPADVSALAKMQMRRVLADIDAILAAGDAAFNNARGRGEDRYARAHLESMKEKIEKTLNAVQTIGGGASSGIVISF